MNIEPLHLCNNEDQQRDTERTTLSNKIAGHYETELTGSTGDSQSKVEGFQFSLTRQRAHKAFHRDQLLPFILPELKFGFQESK